MSLAVPKTHAATALAAWDALGAPASPQDLGRELFWRGFEDEPVGAAVLALGRQLGASYTGALQLARTAFFDDEDLASAPLARVVAGSIQGALGETGVTRGTTCPTCGLMAPAEPNPSALVRGDLAADNEILVDRGIWVISAGLMDALPHRDGLSPKGIPGTDGRLWFTVRPRDSLGYPSGGYQWEHPCATCGERFGSAPDDLIEGRLVYPRRALTGAGYYRSGDYPEGLFVTPEVARVLSGRKAPDPGLALLPVELDDGEPAYPA